MTQPALAPWLLARQQQVEKALDKLLPKANVEPAALHEAMRYAAMDGGKRIRPMLAYAAGEMFDVPAGALDTCACAVECIHAYSLVHDDLPCMDNDVLRRGKPTVHVAYGEAQAMLVGDGLQALAFKSLTQALEAGVAAQQLVPMVNRLADAAGSLGMVGGQALDIAATGHALPRPALEQMHQKKTGALLSASVMLGAMCSPHSAPSHAALEAFAGAIGLAFQVVDDILDVVADSATLGKTAGKDAEHNKATYVSLLGLDEARRLAQQLHEQAHAALASTQPGNPAGLVRLGQLADFICDRRS
jgi:farnesyl diphosphate synthase